MERLHTPRPSEGSSLDTLHPLPSAPSLPALLQAVSSPGVLQEEVDALLRALILPLAENELPRARADFLLSVLEATQSAALKGSEGHSVRVATVEALLELGYPYALEVPPEALDEVSRARVEATARDIPRVGIAAAAIALITQTVLFLPAVPHLTSGRDGSIVAVLFFLGSLWGPSSCALLGGWLRRRALQRLGLLTMALFGSLWLSLFALDVATGTYTMHVLKTLGILTAGVSLIAGAVLLRNPEWRARQKAPPRTPTQG